MKANVNIADFVPMLNILEASARVRNDAQSAISIAERDLRTFERRIDTLYTLLEESQGRFLLNAIRDAVQATVKSGSVVLEPVRLTSAEKPQKQPEFDDLLGRLTEFTELIRKVAEIKCGIAVSRAKIDSVEEQTSQLRNDLARQYGRSVVDQLLRSARYRNYPGELTYQIADVHEIDFEATIVDLGDLATYFGSDLSEVNGEVINTLLHALQSAHSARVDELLRQVVKDTTPLFDLFEAELKNRSSERFDFSKKNPNRPIHENINTMNRSDRFDFNEQTFNRSSFGHNTPNEMNRDKR